VLDQVLAAGFDDWWLFRQDEDLDDLRDDPRFRTRAHEHASWK
jgi:hypothetical protein